jgi:tetratricopeptide (TPR) repeat protein
LSRCSTSGEGKQDFNYLVCGSEGCTHELQLNPEELRKGNYTIRCACGHQADIRVVQREIKLAREFFDRARATLDADTNGGSDGAGDVERAAQSLTHALRLRAKYLHPLHRELGRTHDALAEAHARLGRYEAAATHLERAVTVLESVFPPFSFELADQYAKLAQAWCHARSDPRRALAWVDKAERLWTVLTGSAATPDLQQQQQQQQPLTVQARRGGQRVLDELKQVRAELNNRK